MTAFAAAWTQEPGGADRAVRSMLDVVGDRSGESSVWPLGPYGALGIRTDNQLWPGPRRLSPESVVIPFSPAAALSPDIERAVEREMTGRWVVLSAETDGLVVSLDAVGLHPVAFTCVDGWGVLAASEVAQVLGSGVRSFEPDWGIVLERLSGRPQTPGASVFSGIGYVMPGSTSQLRPGGAKHRTWRTWPETPEHAVSDDRWAAIVRETLRTAILNETAGAATSGLGLTLSGGLDSAGIAGALHEFGLSGQTTALTQRFHGLDCDESVFQDAVLRAAPMREISTGATDFDFQRDIVDRTRRFGIPVFRPDHDADALYERATRSGVRRILSGHGGDDVFLAYRRLITQTIAQRRRADLALFARHNRTPTKAAALIRNHSAEAFRRGVPTRAKSILRRGVPAWINPDVAQHYDLARRIAHPLVGIGAASSTRLRRHNLLESAGTVLEREVMEAQRARHGIDHRYPFLSAEVIDLALRIPDDARWGLYDSRALQRSAQWDWLPTEVQERRGKVHFDFRYGASLDDADVEERLSSSLLADLGFVDLEPLRELWRSVVLPIRADPNDVAPGSNILWQFVGLDVWSQEFAS